MNISAELGLKIFMAFITLSIRKLNELHMSVSEAIQLRGVFMSDTFPPEIIINFKCLLNLQAVMTELINLSLRLSCSIS